MAQTKARTVGEVELAVNQAIIRFEKEFMGRGPFDTRTYLVEDMVIVRLKGSLLQSEITLTNTEDRSRARMLVKEMRQTILDRGRGLLESVIQDITGVPVESVHTDISTRTGERVIIFTLKARPSVIHDRKVGSNGSSRTVDPESSHPL